MRRLRKIADDLKRHPERANTCFCSAMYGNDICPWHGMKAKIRTTK